MQEVGRGSRGPVDAGLLIGRVLYSLAYSTPVSSYHGADYNGGLARELLNELDGVRSRIVEEELNYG